MIGMIFNTLFFFLPKFKNTGFKVHEKMNSIYSKNDEQKSKKGSFVCKRDRHPS